MTLTSQNHSRSRALHVLLCAIALFVTMATPCRLTAQQTTATLSGTVTDDTGALIPGATATLKNSRSGETRSATANSGGFFVFAAVPTGDYDITVKRDGFNSNVLTGIHLDPADNKTLSKVVLKIGSVDQVITVSANDAGITNSGAKSTLITADQIKNLSVQGRDVGELVKILPGFAIAQTSSNIDNSSYDPGQVNITGALRSYAANGNSANGVTLLSDGSNISDPGDYGDSTQNVNTDMVEEVKVQTSNFTAETANGPVVVNAVGKSGTQAYHGSVYAYARTYQMNAQDWLAKYLGQAKPQDRYVYPGANLSGPVRIPGTNFNRSKKLTFFLGGEEYAQRNIYAYGSASQGIIKALVPSQAMRNGDFSCSQLSAYLGSAITCNGNGTSNIVNANYVHLGSVPTQLKNGNTAFGNISSQLDAGAASLLRTMPLPNRTNQGDGYNYVAQNLVNNNMYQLRLRMDYSFNDRWKLFGTYNVERGHSGVPEVPYYSAANSGAPMGGVNTPGGGILSNINSQTGGLNLTGVLSPRLTNEFAVNVTFLNQAFTPKTEGSLQKSAINYPYGGFANSTNFPGNHSTQFPQFHDYGYDGLPLGLFPDFSTGAPYAVKLIPSITDNVTFVVKTHTLKAGVYIQQVTNNQRTALTGSSTNGQMASYYYDPTSYLNPDGTRSYTSGNYLANFMQGEIEQFSQQNYAPPQNLYFWNVNWFVTDSWQVTRRLNIDVGIRFEHLGPWKDKHGIGMAIFDPDTLNNSSLALPGFTWHGIDSTVPVSGVPARFAFYEPRVGLSWDVYGNGKTMFRGGWGMYRSHDNYNVVQNAAALAQGVIVQCVCGGAGIDLSKISTIGGGGIIQDPSSYSLGPGVTAYGLQKGDDQQPLTSTYSFTVDQQLPGKSQLEIGYTGSHGENLTAQNVNVLNMTLQNVNPVPRGAFFKPNPVTGAIVPLSAIDSMSTSSINQYRPYYRASLVRSDGDHNYGNINIPRHVLYSWYNGMQVNWKKQQGNLTYGLNYTWSKALGIRDGYYNGNAVDSTNLRNNYGPLSFDRSQIFNASYTYDFGNRVHGMWLLRGLGNGWLISGITGIQAGPNLQATYYSNFNLTGTLGSGTSALNVDNKTFLGTPDAALQPVMTCDPSVHTKPQQYVNGSCFTLPEIGQNGPTVYPYIHAPAYLNSDLTLAKSFALAHEHSLQFRFAGFNFLNHPLQSFSTSFPQQIALNLSNLTAGAQNGSPSTAKAQSTFGTSTIREGRRVLELALKYNF